MKRFKWQKKRILKNNGIDPDIDMYWSQLKQNTYSDKLDSIQGWLKSQAQLHQDRSAVHQHIGRYQNMLNLLKIKKHSLAYAVFASILLIAACNVPMKYTETVGHVLNWTVSGNADHAEAIIREMEWLDGKDVNLEVVGENGQVFTTISVVLPMETEESFNEIIASVQNHPDLIKYNLAAVDETTSLPAYKMALRNIFHLTIELTDLSEESIAQQIQEQLEQYGAEVSHVDVNLNDDGTIEFGFEFTTNNGDDEEQIDIQMRIDGAADDNNIELNFGGELGGDGDSCIIIEEYIDGPNGGNMQRLKIEASEMENMTDSEAQEYIKNKMKEAGIDAPENIELNQTTGRKKIKVRHEEKSK